MQQNCYLLIVLPEKFFVATLQKLGIWNLNHLTVNMFIMVKYWQKMKKISAWYLINGLLSWFRFLSLAHEKPAFLVFNQWWLKMASSALSKALENIDILSRQWTTQAMTGLCRCQGCCASFLFAYGEYGFGWLTGWYISYQGVAYHVWYSVWSLWASAIEAL